MENITGILMDYGGTIDTNGSHWFEVICKMYYEVGIQPDKEMLRKAYIFAEQLIERNNAIKPSNTFKDVMQLKINYQVTYLVRKKMIEQLTPKRIDELVEGCYTFARHTVHAQIPTLEKLSGHCPLVLVSNFYGNLQSVLKDFGIAQYFRTVIESAIVGIRKPNPEIFRLGIQALGLKPNQVAVVGDSYKNDIAPAKQLGCTTIWLRGLGWNDDEPNLIAADYIIEDLAETPVIFDLVHI